jgi:hypothetical protein
LMQSASGKMCLPEWTIIININKDYRITTDTMNFTLEKFNIPKDKDKESYWTTVGYFRDLDQCYKKLMRLGINETDGVTDVINYIRGLHDDFISAVMSKSYLGANKSDTKVVLYYK